MFLYSTHLHLKLNSLFIGLRDPITLDLNREKVLFFIALINLYSRQYTTTVQLSGGISGITLDMWNIAYIMKRSV